MGDKSNIEWTDATWNPTVGCTRVSSGCTQCYAFSLHDMRHKAYMAGKKLPKQYAKPFSEVQTFANRLDQPLKWKRPRKIFVNSLSDLFHKDIPFDFIRQVFDVMQQAYWHTFQVLTKRPERMKEFMDWYLEINKDPFDENDKPYIAPNIWLGTSVENQKAADERIPLLLQTPAAIRFLSCEPLLGRVDLSGWLFTDDHGNSIESPIQWVIAGGESGHGAHPMHPDWVRSLRDQCQAAGVSYFFKQWGEWAPVEEVMDGFLDDNAHRLSSNTIIGLSGWGKHSEGWNGCGLSSLERQSESPLWHMKRIGKHKAGRLLDGREWNEFPEVKS